MADALRMALLGLLRKGELEPESDFLRGGGTRAGAGADGAGEPARPRPDAPWVRPFSPSSLALL